MICMGKLKVMSKVLIILKTMLVGKMYLLQLRETKESIQTSRFNQMRKNNNAEMLYFLQKKKSC